MSTGFSDFKKNWDKTRFRRFFKNIKLVNDGTKKYLNPWFLPLIYSIVALVNLTGNTWYPNVILWSISLLLCFTKTWEITPFLKKVKPKNRMMRLSLFVCLGYSISMLLKII
jgi:hypothetical protein